MWDSTLRLADHVLDRPAGMPNARLRIEVNEHAGEMMFHLRLVGVDVHILSPDRVQAPHDLLPIETIIGKNGAIYGYQ